MGNYKSLGPNGFHPAFSKSQWEHIEKSVFEFITHVRNNPANIAIVNQTLLALIPETN